MLKACLNCLINIQVGLYLNKHYVAPARCEYFSFCLFFKRHPDFVLNVTVKWVLSNQPEPEVPCTLVPCTLVPCTWKAIDHGGGGFESFMGDGIFKTQLMGDNLDFPMGTYESTNVDTAAVQGYRPIMVDSTLPWIHCFSKGEGREINIMEYFYILTPTIIIPLQPNHPLNVLASLILIK